MFLAELQLWYRIEKRQVLNTFKNPKNGLKIDLFDN